MKSLEYADCIGYDACIISYCLYLMCNHLLPLMNRLPQCGVTFKLERVKYIIGSFSYWWYEIFMYIRLLWCIVMEYHFLRISMLITFWKVYQTSKRRKHHTWASFCVHSLIQPIYTIQSKIERMLFKSLCLLSPYMHHFISSIIITVLCVPKITCPCFPILGCIKNTNLQVQTITYYLPIENKNNTNTYWGIEKNIENIQNGCYIFEIIEKLALLY